MRLGEAGWWRKAALGPVSPRYSNGEALATRGPRVIEMEQEESKRRAKGCTVKILILPGAQSALPHAQAATGPPWLLCLPKTFLWRLFWGQKCHSGDVHPLSTHWGVVEDAGCCEGAQSLVS